MRLLDEEERLPLSTDCFPALPSPCRGVRDQQRWRLLDCYRADDPDQHIPGGIRAGSGKTEAAWKYIVVVSGGISLALLGTVLFYWGGSFVLGPAIDDLGRAPSSRSRGLPAAPLVSFLLVLVGYGTKAGLGAYAYLAARCA